MLARKYCVSLLEHKTTSPHLHFAYSFSPPLSSISQTTLLRSSPILLHLLSVLGKGSPYATTMGTVPGELDGRANPTIEAIEHKADAIFDHAITSATHKATMDKIAFPISSLPVELQTGIVNFLRDYSDLRALCLASKHISDIATPRLYYKLDLSNGGKCQSSQLIQRIKSLLIQPANLRFVRIIKTPLLGPEESQLMGQLLPLLQQDSLMEFKYWAISANHFPTPPQMRFIWNHQKNLQNQKLFTHMVPELDILLKERGPSQSGLLKSFTELDIHDRTDECLLDIPRMMSWPLESLDMGVLQKLRICGLIDRVVWSSLDTLFARGSFVNLTELTLSRIFFFKILTFNNLPSLKELYLRECRGFSPSLPLPLVLADDIKLSAFYCWIFGNVQEMTPFLAQMKGLECLHITRRHPIMAMDQAQKELVCAIISHKETLRELNLEESLDFDTDLDIVLWDSHVVMAIESCKKLVNLSLPLVSNRSIYYYRDLIARFPDLENLTIYDRPATCAFPDQETLHIYDGPIHYANWSRDNLMILFSASAHLKVICFKTSIPYRSSKWERRFERKESGVVVLFKTIQSV